MNPLAENITEGPFIVIVIMSYNKVFSILLKINNLFPFIILRGSLLETIKSKGILFHSCIKLSAVA